jgi:hypothetical protein
MVPISVVKQQPQEAETFGRTRNEVSAPAPNQKEEFQTLDLNYPLVQFINEICYIKEMCIIFDHLRLQECL